MAKKTKKRRWGAGEIEETPTGYTVRWRQNGVRRRQSGLPSRDLAEKVLAKVRGEIAQGRAGMPLDQRGVPTLQELGDNYIERRKKTHSAGVDDASRWRKHLAPYFGAMKPGTVDTGIIRSFIELKLAEKCNPASVHLMIALLSSVYLDLLEKRLAETNPCRGLPDSVMRLMRSTHDPRNVPFVEKLSDVRRIFLALPPPLHVAYAIGALGGLRPGEIFALRWANVDLETRRIYVRESVKGPTKDKDPRMVPVMDSLLPILAAWKLQHRGERLVVPPMRMDGRKLNKGTPGPHLRRVLEQLQLYRPGLAWYEATRHTFASQWVMAGGSIEKLKEVLGHYSVVVTERYAHLKPELFTADDLGTIQLDMRDGAKPGSIGPKMPKAAKAKTAKARN